MTNHWNDIQHADVILAIGSNPAENHPISFKYVERAMDRGGKLISVDPRYTRTSSKADLYAQLRPGTDIAFMGGLINYALQNDLIHRDYVLHYTNASFLVDDGFAYEEGIFSGYSPENFSYEKSTWKYQSDRDGQPLRDASLQHPRCVYQLMKAHYAGYTPEQVCEITGTAIQDFMAVARTFCATAGPDKAGTIMYAMGTTQHTYGTQNVRSYAMLQLLLGNIGIAGGGINALRGEANVQGSTDYALLYHILPGYLKSPEYNDVNLADYLAKVTPKATDAKSANWWSNTPKYVTSLLKAWWGEHATAANDYDYAYLPKRSGNYSFIMLMDRLQRGGFEGLFCMGTNPIVGGPDSLAIGEGLGKLKWLVAADLWETDTSVFWKRPGVKPQDIQTEVFLLPAASSVEKQGSVSNSGRWAQWRYKAVEPPGAAESDAFIIDQLCRRLKKLYAAGGVFPEPIVNLAWNYGSGHEPDIDLVAREINGYFTRDVEMHGRIHRKGEQVPGFGMLQDDGSTVSGNWLYCGSFTEDGNQMQRRGKEDPTGLEMYHQWAWCWPVNRRILYNRASVDGDGKPWDAKRPVIWWNGGWKGDVPDGPWPPMNAAGGKKPFIMTADGVGALFAPGLNEGPFPEHYEPLECPLEHNPLSGTRINPVVRLFFEAGGAQEDAYFSNDQRYPYVATTYRVTEHWQTGVMTRNTPWLLEMQPHQFVELSTELAKEKGIKGGDMVTVSSGRGKIEAVAVVTRRFQPFRIQNSTVHQIGLPWHYGWHTPKVGDSANLLTPSVGDGNTMIPETKAFMVNIEKKRG